MVRKKTRYFFRGDRLQPRFDNIPGQWDRIWINEGGFNEINYAVIQNSFIGIQAEALFLGNGPSELGRLLIQNTRIENASGFGLLSAYFQLRAEKICSSSKLRN